MLPCLGGAILEHASIASITDYTAGARQSRTLTYSKIDRLIHAVGPGFSKATNGDNVLDDVTPMTATDGSTSRDHMRFRNG